MQNSGHVISHVLLIYTLDATVEQLHYMLISHSRVVVIKVCVYVCVVFFPAAVHVPGLRGSGRTAECVFIC